MIRPALSHVDPSGRVRVSDVALHLERSGCEIEAPVRTSAKAGVEMEAPTAVAVAALTVCDMVRATDREMVIGDTRLVEKRGGRGGHRIRREAGATVR